MFVHIIYMLALISFVSLIRKLILILVFILIGLHNFNPSFYYISEIILVLVFIPFYENNFSFYLILVLV